MLNNIINKYKNQTLINVFEMLNVKHKVNNIQIIHLLMTVPKIRPKKNKGNSENPHSRDQQTCNQRKILSI